MAVTIYTPADVAPLAECPPNSAPGVSEIGTGGVTLRRPMATPKKPTKPPASNPPDLSTCPDPTPSAAPRLRIVIHHMWIVGSEALEHGISPQAEGQPMDVEIVLPEGSGFADVGREASRAAQRVALLSALQSQEWNLSAVARELKITDTSAVIRALKALAPDEYKAAKRDGRIAPGRRRNS